MTRYDLSGACFYCGRPVSGLGIEHDRGSLHVACADIVAEQEEDAEREALFDAELAALERREARIDAVLPLAVAVRRERLNVERGEDEEATDDDALDDLMDDCGLLPDHLGGGCTLAGSEQCDFECPFR